MNIIIEKGIAIPPRQVAKKKCQYPFDEMRPGDSFFILAMSHERAEVVRDSIKGAFYRWKKNNGIVGYRDVTRIQEEDGVLGVRIWIIKEDE